MPGPPVSYGCAVMITPGAAGPPDTGTLITIFPPFVATAGGLPLATAGSLCLMVNSITGVPYPLLIGPAASSGVTLAGRALIRAGDNIPTPPGILTVLGPPAAPWIVDQSPP
ncbi:MAG: hypothetical protein JWQ37_685 [Blastococcus sp.]|jgi:hypothetical protein|nr:hypothetical protein [Blastococcus sp.]